MKLENFKQFLPGVLLSLILGAAVWILSGFWSGLDPLVSGIVCGIALRTIVGERPRLVPGLNWTPVVLIPPGIIFYGANLRFDFDIVSHLVWLQIFVGIVIVVWLTSSAGRMLKLTKPTSLLLAVGTAICGASAIMIARSAVNGDNRDTAKALLVITIWGLVGLLALPYLAEILGLEWAVKAQLFATTLQQTGFVKVAAAQVGPVCLDAAMTIKIARTLMIIPLLLVVGTLSHIEALKKPSVESQTFKVCIPWYLWCFLVSGLLFSFVPQLFPLAPYINRASSLLWTMAMVSIGLTVDIREIMTSFARPLLVGLMAWLALIAVFAYTYINTL